MNKILFTLTSLVLLSSFGLQAAAEDPKIEPLELNGATYKKIIKKTTGPVDGSTEFDIEMHQLKTGSSLLAGNIVFNIGQSPDIQLTVYHINNEESGIREYLLQEAKWIGAQQGKKRIVFDRKSWAIQPGDNAPLGDTVAAAEPSLIAAVAVLEALGYVQLF